MVERVNIEELRHNTLYQLGEDHFLHITPGRVPELGGSIYNLYKRRYPTVIEIITQPRFDEEHEFTDGLASLIREHGPIKQASIEDLQHLVARLGTAAASGNVFDKVTNRAHINNLLNGAKIELAAHIITNLKQALGGAAPAASYDFSDIPSFLRSGDETELPREVSQSPRPVMGTTNHLPKAPIKNTIPPVPARPPTLSKAAAPVIPPAPVSISSVAGAEPVANRKGWRLFGAPQFAEVDLSVKNGKLSGDIKNLRANGLYALGNDHFVQLLPGKHLGVSYNLFKKTSDGRIEGIDTVTHDVEHRLLEEIRVHGSLKSVSIKDRQEIETFIKSFAATSKQAKESLGCLQQDAIKLPRSAIKSLKAVKLGPMPPTFTAVDGQTVSAVEESAKPKRWLAGIRKKLGFSPKEAIERKDPTIIAPGESTAVVEEVSAAKTEGAFARFMKNEKWAGKKGLAFAGATVALGVIGYGGYELTKPTSQKKSWTHNVASGQQAPTHRTV